LRHKKKREKEEKSCNKRKKPKTFPFHHRLKLYSLDVYFSHDMDDA